MWTFIQLIFLTFLTLSCSFAPKYQIERIDDRTVKLQELKYQENTFKIQPKNNKLAWDRGKMFFKFYLDESKENIKISNDYISNTYTNGRYIYEVTRKYQPELVFNVNCFLNNQNKTKDLKTEINAKLLSSFIEKGSFETSLLNK